jgi:hypothetical protein
MKAMCLLLPAGMRAVSAPPNDGKLNRASMMNINMSEVAGFDISPSSGEAYIAARIRDSVMAALYGLAKRRG